MGKFNSTNSLVINHLRCRCRENSQTDDDDEANVKMDIESSEM